MSIDGPSSKPVIYLGKPFPLLFFFPAFIITLYQLIERQKNKEYYCHIATFLLKVAIFYGFKNIERFERIILYINSF